MRLMGLWLRNFMRFKSAYVALNDAGRTLIEGINKDDESATSNGAGKSTIVDALVWCLYGVTTHEPSAQGDDVVNERRLKNCEVRVRFMLDETSYEVTRRRAWKKGGKAVQLTLKRYTRDDVRDLSKGTHRDTQAEIDKLVGMSVATFRHACVFGQGRAYRFSRLTDSEKKAVLDEMLGSEVYAKAGQKASDRLTVAERELAKAEDSLETALDSLQDARKRLGKLRTRAETAKRETQARRVKLENKLGHAKVLLGAIVVSKRRENALVIAEMNETKAQHAWRKAMSIADESVLALKRLEKERARISSQGGMECVTCGQTIDERHTEKQLNAIDEKIEMQSAKDHIADEALKAAHKEYEDAKAKRKAIAAENEKARDDERVREKLEDEVKHLRGLLRELKNEYDFNELIADEKRYVRKQKKRVRKLRVFVKLRKAEVEQLRFWQQGFSAKGLRSLMLDSSLPFLNAKLDQYTNALTAGNIEIEFKTQRELKGGGVREDFHIDVRNRFGSTKYNMNSIGERAKIDIIVGLALQDMAASRSKVPVNVAFFDEVFDGLDDRGIDRAVQVLSQLKRESAFIISHKSELKTFFSRRIVVVKEHGESRLEAA